MITYIELINRTVSLSLYNVDCDYKQLKSTMCSLINGTLRNVRKINTSARIFFNNAMSLCLYLFLSEITTKYRIIIKLFFYAKQSFYLNASKSWKKNGVNV